MSDTKKELKVAKSDFMIENLHSWEINEIADKLGTRNIPVWRDKRLVLECWVPTDREP